MCRMTDLSRYGRRASFRLLGAGASPERALHGECKVQLKGQGPEILTESGETIHARLAQGVEVRCTNLRTSPRGRSQPFIKRRERPSARILPRSTNQNGSVFWRGSLDSPARDVYGPIFAMTRASTRERARQRRRRRDPPAGSKPQAVSRTPADLVAQEPKAGRAAPQRNQ